MATVNLPFGRDKISVTIPDSRLNGILLSGAHSYHPDGGDEKCMIVTEQAADAFIYQLSP